MSVGIFGDQLIPQGPDVPATAAEVVEEPTEVVEEVNEIEEVVEENNETTEEVVNESEETSEEEVEEETATAAEVVEAISKAETSEEVDAIVGDDDRKTVLKAAEKRKKELDSE